VGKKIRWKRIEHECEHEDKSKQKMKNRTKGFSSTGNVEQEQKPTSHNFDRRAGLGAKV